MILYLLAMCLETGDVSTLAEFQPSTDAGGAALEQPFSMSFSPDGHLFVLDRKPGRIHRWGPGGAWLGSFAEQGRDGGQIHWPVRIVATDEAVWIWENRFRISVWSHAGKMTRVVNLPGITPHGFGLPTEDRLLLSFRRNPFAPGFSHVFELYTTEGEQVAELMRVPQDWLIPSPKGRQYARVRAFGPEGDLQRDDKGRYWFGFSRNTTLHRLEKDAVAETKIFRLETSPPSAREMEVMNLLPLPLAVDGAGPKSHYTHFLIKNGKVVFVRTPMGGMPPAHERHPANGFHQADYTVCRFDDGSVITSGAYAYPPGSVVLYRDGRVLAFIKDETGAFAMEEIILRGME
jgi:hypothetical protein